MAQAPNEEGLGGIFDIIANFIERLFDMILSFIEGLLNIGGRSDE